AALEAGRAAAALTPDRVRLAEEAPQRGRWETPVAIDPFAIPIENKIAALAGPVETMRRDARIQSAQAHVFFRRVEKRLVTSDGTDVEQSLVHGACGLHAIASWQNDVQQRSYPLDYDGGVGARGWELVAALDLAGNAERVREEAIALCAAPPLP